MSWKRTSHRVYRPRGKRPRVAAHVTRDRRLAEGLCVDCGERPRRPGRLRCGPCAEREKQRAAWEMLRAKLHEQGFRCWYSGRAITPGVDASVDHVVPLARGGTHEPSNLRWVHLKVNEVKRGLSEDEFFRLCDDVARHTRQRRLL